MLHDTWVGLGLVATMMAAGCEPEPESLPGPSRAAGCEQVGVPALAATLELSLPHSPVVIDDVGYALVDDHLVRIDLSNPAAPEPLPSWPLIGDVRGRRLFALGEQLVVTGEMLTVYEPGPEGPRIVGRIDPDPSFSGETALVDQVLYVGSSRPWAVDLTDPAEPVLREGIPHAEAGLVHMWPSERSLLGTDEEHRLLSYEALAPGEPQLTKIYEPSGEVGFATRDPDSGLVYAVVWDPDAAASTLRVLAHGPGQQLVERGRTPTLPGVIAMERVGDQLLVFRPDLMLVYDIFDPEAPIEVERIEYRDDRPKDHRYGDLTLLSPYALVAGQYELDVMTLCEPAEEDSALSLSP